MIKPVKLYLIRHAPVKQVKGYFPEHNPDAIIKNNQLKMLATLIPNNCVWYVSPLKRAIQTAEALSKFVNYSEMVRENKLIEQNFGDWSGKKISDVWEVLKECKTKHNFSFISPDFSPPNGESFKEQSKRVGIWLEKLDVLKGKSIVIISHAGTIRSILSYALKIKNDYAIGIEIRHQSLNILEMINKNDNRHKGGRFRLLALNIEV
ncbi:MAG: histidine phosphatase family protein [Alphaproteobacteria bacterium]